MQSFANLQTSQPQNIEPLPMLYIKLQPILSSIYLQLNDAISLIEENSIAKANWNSLKLGVNSSRSFFIVLLNAQNEPVGAYSGFVGKDGRIIGNVESADHIPIIASGKSEHEFKFVKKDVSWCEQHAISIKELDGILGPATIEYEKIDLSSQSLGVRKLQEINLVVDFSKSMSDEKIERMINIIKQTDFADAKINLAVIGIVRSKDGFIMPQDESNFKDLKEGKITPYFLPKANKQEVIRVLQNFAENKNLRGGTPIYTTLEFVSKNFPGAITYILSDLQESSISPTKVGKKFREFKNEEEEKAACQNILQHCNAPIHITWLSDKKTDLSSSSIELSKKTGGIFGVASGLENFEWVIKSSGGVFLENAALPSSAFAISQSTFGLSHPSLNTNSPIANILLSSSGGPFYAKAELEGNKAILSMQSFEASWLSFAPKIPIIVCQEKQKKGYFLYIVDGSLSMNVKITDEMLEKIKQSFAKQGLEFGLSKLGYWDTIMGGPMYDSYLEALQRVLNFRDLKYYVLITDGTGSMLDQEGDIRPFDYAIRKFAERGTKIVFIIASNYPQEKKEHSQKVLAGWARRTGGTAVILDDSEKIENLMPRVCQNLSKYILVPQNAFWNAEAITGQGKLQMQMPVSIK